MTRCHIRFVEFNCGDEPDEIELCEMLLDDELKTASEKRQYVFVCAGERNGLEILKKVCGRYPINVLYCFYYGNTKVCVEDRLCFYTLVSLEYEPDYVEIMNIDDSSEKRLADYLADSSSKQKRFSVALRNLQSASREQGYAPIENALRDLKSVSTEIVDSTFRESMLRALRLIRRLLLLETDSTKKDGIGTSGQLARATWKDQFEKTAFEAVVRNYKEVMREDLSLAKDVVNNWANYYQLGLNAADKLNSQVRDQDIAIGYVWLARNILIKALRASQDGEYAAGVALCIRCLELFSIVILINKGLVAPNIHGKLELSGKKVSGVGPLWKIASQIVMNDLEEDLINDLWTSIEIRNNTLFGHGGRFANKEVFDFVYRATSQSFMKSQDINSSATPIWSQLVQMSNKTIKNIACEYIVEKTIANTARAC